MVSRILDGRMDYMLLSGYHKAPLSKVLDFIQDIELLESSSQKGDAQQTEGGRQLQCKGCLISPPL
jgi:hypothetical protein